jgi:hypothetical protein
MNLKKILTISLLCTVWYAVRGTSREVKAEDLPQEIVQALNSGDAKVIAKYFNSSVELIFSDKRDVYAKAHAEQVLKNFFTNNPVDTGAGKVNYTHRHTSGVGKENVRNYIGELRTGKGTFRIHIFMKDQRIYEMRIENND